MIFIIIHIVRENERVQDILKNYNISLDDLKVCNLHITNFSDLKPATKLRIPSINSETVEVLNQSEPLVSQYYEPEYKLDDDNLNVNSENKTQNNNNNINRFGFRGLNFIIPPRLKRQANKSIYPHYVKKNNEDENNK